MNKEKREILHGVSLLAGITEVVWPWQVTNYSKMFKIDSLRSPRDPWKTYHITRESRYKGTTAWFVGGSTLSEWKSSGPSSLLRIHGKRWFPNPDSFAKANNLP